MTPGGAVRLLGKALLFAIDAHGLQQRKGTDIPYISHPLAVASLVLEDGGSWDDAVAALLHDVVEDTPRTLDEVRAAFGDYVAGIVEGCSDSFGQPKAPWRTRKQDYLATLPSHSPAVLRVSVADKLHNARSILHDVEREGPATLDRFNGGREGTVWYYQALVQAYRDAKVAGRNLDELERVVAELASNV